MHEPHLTLWVGDIPATESLKMGKKQIADFRRSVDVLVAFGKKHGLPVEDWSMLGDTRLTIDIPVGPKAVEQFEAYTADSALPQIDHAIAFKFDEADPEQADALAAAVMKIGLSVQPA